MVWLSPPALLVTVALAAAVGGMAVGDLAVAPARWRVRRRIVGGIAPRPPSVPPRLTAAFVASGLPWPADRCWLLWRSLVGGAAVLGMAAGGLTLAALLVAATAVLPGVALVAARDRAARLADAGLPDALDGVARSLRAGASLVQAIAEAASSAPPLLAGELRRVATTAASGVSLGGALEEWRQRQPRPPVRLAVAALGMAADAGGTAARPIDGVATSLRANLAVAAEVRSLSSQARYSGVVIALAPIGFGIVAAGADPRTADFLLRTRVGVSCVAGGIVLDAVGAWWMHCITRSGS